ncbi:hypothetical protein DEO72_LG5g1752 [Vigna unguiculata]|uniref:Uncharacterized protein n=1 Tax=Vigna unguiculata TaxID=3917 RepID=A0A4D6M0D3_VIGUN|nr:hypothetical protein DEO72_LG5g1752 [Vigna unguiculata]
MGSLYFAFLAYLFIAQTLPIVRLVDEIGVPGEEEEKEDLNRKLIEKKAFPLSCLAKFELRSLETHAFRLACLFETLDLLSNPHAMIGKMDLNRKCYLLVFPEETIDPSIPYGNRNKRRTKPYIAVFRGIENVYPGKSPIRLVPFHSSLNVSAWGSGTARSLFSFLVCYA